MRFLMSIVIISYNLKDITENRIGFEYYIVKNIPNLFNLM